MAKMRVKSKRDLKVALAQVMELSKIHSSLSFGHERERWEKILDIVDDALERPSIAEINDLIKNRVAAGGCPEPTGEITSPPPLPPLPPPGGEAAES